jgi:hypothetical protein
LAETVMTRPKRYLTRMTLFVIAVVLVAAILLPGLATAFMANPALNGVILAVLVIGIAFTYRSVIGLVPEIRWLESFQAARAGLVVEEEPPEPRLLAPMARMMGERHGRLTFSAMSMRSLLDTINARLGEGREITRYFIGLLIFLGLLGTFWGLLQTIDAVGGVITGLSVASGDLELVFADLKQGLEAPLSGMGTAFSSSLFGLAGSLVLGFLELQASQAQNRFYNELEDWLSGAARLTGGGLGGEGEASVPAYLQALMEQTADNLDALQRTVAQSEDNRRHTITSLNALTQKLTTLSDQMSSEQNLLVKLAEGQMELRGVLARLGEAASSGSLGIDDTSRKHLRNLDFYMQRLVEDLPAGRDQSVAEIRSEIKLLARTIAALAEESEPR